MPDSGPTRSDIVARSTVYRDTLVALTLLTLGTIIGCVLLYILRPGDKDNVTAVTLLIGLSSATSVVLVTLSKGQEATHQLVNSNMVAFRTLIREEAETAISNARLAGQKSGRVEGRDIANERADQLQASREARADAVQAAQESRADQLSERARQQALPAATEHGKEILEVVEETRGDVKGIVKKMPSSVDHE